MSATRQASFVIVCCVALASCGFHLRGSARLPPGMDVAYVQDGDPATTLATPLRQALTSNGARLAQNAGEADATIRIVSESFDRRLLGTGRTAKEKDYELIYAAKFAAQAKDNAWTLDEQEVRVIREMTFNEDQVLAKTAEQDQLRQTMVQDAARQILLRLQAKAR